MVGSPAAAAEGSAGLAGGTGRFSRTRLTAWRPEGMAVLSGLLLTLSFPKFGHGLVAFVALTPLLVALRGVSSARALCLGYISGAVWALGTVYWTAFIRGEDVRRSAEVDVLVAHRADQC